MFRDLDWRERTRNIDFSKNDDMDMDNSPITIFHCSNDILYSNSTTMIFHWLDMDDRILRV